MLKRSMIDQILGLRVLIEHRLDYQRGILSANIDFMKMLDSVYMGLHWSLIGGCRIPAGTCSLILTLYTKQRVLSRLRVTLEEYRWGCHDY